LFGAKRQPSYNPPTPPPLKKTKQLVDLFGGVRDEWMAADLASWLAPNAIYPGVADAVRASLARGDDVHVVTTKQARFTAALLRDMARVDLPEERIHSTTVSGEPKSKVLARLDAALPGACERIFVEDKHATLEKVRAAPETAGRWRLMLVGWGYNTPAERAAADACPDIELVGIGRFAEVLRGDGGGR
jgi:phosphoglycolate phosphatase-like HAD superfamily hydrolase